MGELADAWSAPRADEPVGRGAARDRDAERRRRRRRVARRPAGGRPRDDLHGVPGAAADAAEHVQDRRRADAVRDARGGSHAGDTRAVDLRRSLRRDGGAHHRVRDAVLLERAGGSGPGARRAFGDASHARAVPALLRWVPHVARGRQDPTTGRRRSARPDRRGGDPRASRPRAVLGAPSAARLGAEPRRLLPGARGVLALLRGGPRRRAGRDGRARRPGPAGPTGCSTTSGTPRPSACS